MKNKLLDLDKCFYSQKFSKNQIYKLVILKLKKNIISDLFFLFSVLKIKTKMLYYTCTYHTIQLIEQKNKFVDNDCELSSY